jgi:hypothetical protein
MEAAAASTAKRNGVAGEAGVQLGLIDGGGGDDTGSAMATPILLGYGRAKG